MLLLILASAGETLPADMVIKYTDMIANDTINEFFLFIKSLLKTNLYIQFFIYSISRILTKSSSNHSHAST